MYVSKPGKMQLKIMEKIIHIMIYQKKLICNRAFNMMLNYATSEIGNFKMINAHDLGGHYRQQKSVGIDCHLYHLRDRQNL